MRLPRDWLTTAEVAKLLGVTPRRVLALGAARKVPSLKVGRARVWLRSALPELAPGAAGRPRKATPSTPGVDEVPRAA